MPGPVLLSYYKATSTCTVNDEVNFILNDGQVFNLSTYVCYQYTDDNSGGLRKNATYTISGPFNDNPNANLLNQFDISKFQSTFCPESCKYYRLSVCINSTAQDIAYCSADILADYIEIPVSLLDLDGNSYCAYVLEKIDVQPPLGSTILSDVYLNPDQTCFCIPVNTCVLKFTDCITNEIIYTNETGMFNISLLDNRDLITSIDLGKGVRCYSISYYCKTEA